MNIKIAPSILASDFSKLGETVRLLEENGADYIHCDIMDGNFVPPITFGAQAVKAIRPHTSLPLDCHLMTLRPESRLEEFCGAGANIVTVHVEACGKNTAAVMQKVKALGMKAGVVINPQTPAEEVFPYVPIADMVLVMSVVPGWGGQKFIPGSLEKIRKIRAFCRENDRPELDIEVDGGITEENVKAVIEAGANVIVAGSTVFRSPDMAATIRRLRG